MVVLASTFLECSLLVSPAARSTSLFEAQRSRSSSFLVPSASLQGTEEEHHMQQKKPPSYSSWIFFFLAGSSQKPPIKPLIEDMGASPADATTFESVPNRVSLNASSEPGKISTKKGPRGAKRVSFTPQKARELRNKLKGTDSFHDLMYHSAIASRLASHDS